MGVEDKLPSGAGLTSAEKRAGWARARSLWPTTFGLACFAWVGQRLWLAARTVIRAVRLANDQQVHVWECVLITSGAAPLTAAGPLRWVPSLGGYRLVGSHLPAPNPSETGR